MQKCSSKPRSVALLVICGIAPPNALLRGADDGQILDRARQAYYSLRGKGLVEFRCEVLPDWEAVFSTLRTDAVGSEVLTLLQRTHFDVSVGADGASTVSRQTELTPPSQVVAERFRTAAAGLEQMLTGFFVVWAQFMSGFPGPEPGDKDYKIEKAGDQYRITQQQGQLHVLVLMTTELVVTEARLTAPNSVEITVHPHFSKLAERFLLTGWDSTIGSAAGTLETAATTENQEVEGFELPKTVNITAGGIRIPLRFNHYRIKKRSPP
jgi:hypothetical protein